MFASNVAIAVKCFFSPNDLKDSFSRQDNVVSLGGETVVEIHILRRMFCDRETALAAIEV